MAERSGAPEGVLVDEVSVAQVLDRVTQMSSELRGDMAGLMASLGTIKSQVQALHAGLNGVKEDLHGVKEDLHGVKEDLHGVKEDLHGVKEDLHGVKEDLRGVKEDLHGVKEDLHGVKEDLHGVKEELHGVKEKLHESHFVVPPKKMKELPGKVFYLVSEDGGEPQGCGFFVKSGVAITACHNFRPDECEAKGVSLRDPKVTYTFKIAESDTVLDFAILTCEDNSDYFDLTTLEECSTLLGNQKIAVISCGIAMAEQTSEDDGITVLPLGLTITQAAVSHVGVYKNRFAYSAATYRGDSGACLYCSLSGTAVGLHVEGLNAALQIGGEIVQGKRKRKQLPEIAATKPSTGASLDVPDMAATEPRTLDIREQLNSVVANINTTGMALFLGGKTVREAIGRADTGKSS